MNPEQFPDSSETPVESIRFDDDVVIEVPKENIENVSTEPISVRRLREMREAEGWKINQLNHRGRFAEAEVMQMSREARDTKDGLQKEQNELIASIDRGVRGLRETRGGLLAGGVEYETFDKADKAQIEEWVLDLLEGFAEADSARKSEVVQALRGIRKIAKPEYFDIVANQFFPDLNINLDDTSWDAVQKPTGEKLSFFKKLFG